VKVPYDEGVANRIGPEPCASNGEASVGECIGQPLSRVRLWFRVPTPLQQWKAICTGATARAAVRPGVVRDPGMCRRSLSLGTGRARVRPLGLRPPVRVRKVRNRS
jgi:hypothetical protein